MRQDHRSGVVSQSDLDDFARINAGLRQGAAEELDVLHQPILPIEQERKEDFVRQLGELGAEVVTNDLGRR